jgi:hypothetical protein
MYFHDCSLRFDFLKLEADQYFSVVKYFRSLQVWNFDFLNFLPVCFGLRSLLKIEFFLYTQYKLSPPNVCAIVLCVEILHT